jgi:hypothetical protein
MTLLEAISPTSRAILKEANPVVICFRHRYYKLTQDRFTTIRGKAQFKKLKIGQKVTVETPDKTFPAEIKVLELLTVNRLPIAFLKRDAEYPTFTIGQRQDFVDLLNSFRAPAWAQVTLDSELTVIPSKN